MQIQDFKKLANASEEIIERAYQTLAKNGDIETACVYAPRLLQKMLSDTKSFSIDAEDIPSFISRCIERNLPESLDMLLKDVRFAKYPDKAIFLRQIHGIENYLVAKKHGWTDHEWEKRIVLFQRAWKQETCEKSLTYTGPVLSKYEKTGRYFGYRRTLYWLRWNRGKRYKMYKEILEKNGWGGCKWQAYADYLKEDEDSLPSEIYSRST